MRTYGLQTLNKLLQETRTHPTIKETIKLITLTRQKITYHAMVSSQQTYLQLRGLANHGQDQLNYINSMLHAKIVGVVGKIKRNQLDVRDLEEEGRIMEEQEQIYEEKQINQEIIAEVQHAINNIDLPLSLFKRNDKYWYQDNPKTIEAKNYIQDRMRQDRERRNRIKSEMMKKNQEKNNEEKMRMEREAMEEEQRKRKYHEDVKNRIQLYKKRSEERQKYIEESEKYVSQMKPLYVKIQEKQQNYKAEALEEHKKKLSELRKLHKSIDFAEIQEHQNRILEKEKEKEREREKKKIFNEPIRVSYKSQHHKSMTARSRIGQYDTTQSLYEKKKEYGNIVKNEFKPIISKNLVEEMEERLKILKRKRVKKNPKKPVLDSDYDSEEDNSNEEEEKQKEPVKQPQISDRESEEDEEGEQKPKKKPPRIRGEDEDPNRRQRFEMGVQYLEFARKMGRKAKEGSQNGNSSRIDAAQKTSEKIDEPVKKSERYKNYLNQMLKTNRNTIGHIDTKRMKDEYNKRDRNAVKLTNETRAVQKKIERQEQLLRYKKMKNQEAAAKKVEIDNAVVETIKARLALMGN